MLFRKLLDKVEQKIPDVKIRELQHTLNDFLGELSIGVHYIDEYTGVMDVLSGSQTSGGEPRNTLTDSAAEFPTGNCFVGQTIKNTTDGSEAMITSTTKTTITHEALSGGSDNTWQENDTYEIESRKIPIPKDIGGTIQIFLEYSNGDKYLEVVQDITFEDIHDDEGEWIYNEHCVIKDRIIYFREKITSDDTITILAKKLYSEYEGLMSNTTEVYIPDIYIQAMVKYCIKEICILPIYKDNYSYLYEKMNNDYDRLLQEAISTSHTGKYSIGDSF